MVEMYSIMKLISLIALPLAAGTAMAQANASSPVPSDPVQLLAVAHTVNGLTGDDMKPCI